MVASLLVLWILHRFFYSFSPAPAYITHVMARQLTTDFIQSFSLSILTNIRIIIMSFWEHFDYLIIDYFFLFFCVNRLPLVMQCRDPGWDHDHKAVHHDRSWHYHDGVVMHSCAHSCSLSLTSLCRHYATHCQYRFLDGLMLLELDVHNYRVYQQYFLSTWFQLNWKQWYHFIFSLFQTIIARADWNW